MTSNKINSLLVVFMSCFFYSGTQPEMPQKGFWAMKETLVSHYFIEKADSLSGPGIFELQDENGIPVWLGRHIYKDVCMSGVCKMIRLWLFRDGAGNYLGIQITDKETLTKSYHTEFEPVGYGKADEKAVTNLLNLFNDQKIGVGAYNLI